MALSAFGDELSAFGDALEPAPPPVQAAAPTPQQSAFGDPLSSFGDPLEAEAPAPIGGMAGALMAAQAAPQPVPTQQQSAGNLNDLLPDGLRQKAQALDDFGLSLSKGFVGLGESAVGLGDLVSGGGLGNWLQRSAGYDPDARRKALDQMATPERQASAQALQDAQGFGGTLEALAQNPGNIPHAIVESLPSMLAGGVAGRGIALGAKALGAAPTVAGMIGAGAGEGVVSAGQQAEQTRQQTGDLTLGQAGLAVGAGAATGLLGAAGAKIGRALGIGDIDAMLAGQNGTQVARGLVTRALGGATLESLEEAGQGTSETILGNLAQGKNPFEGVGKNAAMGGVLGAAMGGGANLLLRPNMASQPAPVQQPVQQQQGQAVAAPMPAPAAPQGLHASVMAAMQGQQTPAAPTPFAGSQDINPLMDNLGVQGEQRAQSLDLLRPAEQNIEVRRRGVVTREEQHRLAKLIGIQRAHDADKFVAQIGKAYNAEEIIAMTDHVSDRLKSVLEQQQQIVSGQASDIQKAEFLQSVTDLQNTFGTLAGARAESGRALAAQRRKVFDHRQAQHLMEAIGGVEGVDNLALALGKAVQSGGIANASKLIANRKPGLFDYYFRAALLSGVRTHAVNITSNTLTLGNEMIERGIAASIGGAKRAFTGGKSGETLFAEPLDLLIGTAKGMTKAGSAAVDAFKTGESAMLGVGKQESGVGIRPTQSPMEKAFSLPYRALGAEDSWFATLNFEGELRTLARHQAVADRKAGTLPQDMKLSQRIEQLVQNPTSAMIESAGEHARTNTFNSKAGAFAQAIMSAKAKAPWLNVIVPFVRTPANIVKFGLKRTPLAPAFADVRADFKAGGAKQERAIARVLWGTSVMIGAGALAQAGYITGAGPEDKEEKAALMATGWRPYSIKVGDTYHEHNRLDPFAQWLSMAADLATNDYQHKDAGDVAASLLSSFANATINKTYMQGLSNFSEFLSDPKRNGGWYVRQQAGTLAQPFTLLSNIASENDPYGRETNSVLDAIKYRVPGLRQDLPVKLDHFGEPVPNRTYPGGPLSLAAPIAQSKETTDPVRLEAARIGWAPGKTQNHFTIKKQRFDLSDEQMAEFNELAGKLTHKSVQRAMRSKGWASLGDDEKRDFLDAELKKARTAVRLAFIPYLANDNRRAVDKLRSATGGSDER